MFWIFYAVGGVIGVLIALRFLVPHALLDVKNAWGIWEAIKTIAFQLIQVTVWCCVVFFLSWISVGFLFFYYGDFKEWLERSR
jgi:hypothetical protein